MPQRTPTFERIALLFAKCFGHLPACASAAPGRVNLIGEHTDYNCGFVFPMAISRYTVMAASWNTRRQIHLLSVTTGEQATLNLRSMITPREQPWANYVWGVVDGFQRRGIPIRGFDAVVDSNVPMGGGLSSSGALEVAAATALEALTGVKLRAEEKALLCQAAEHKFAHVPCGIMDQLTSVLALKDHLMLLDCESLKPTMVKMVDPEVSVLIINTNVRHNLAQSEYAKRRATCEQTAAALHVPSLRRANLDLLNQHRAELDPVAFRRARHVITENTRTLQAVEAVRRSKWRQLGKLMYASHKSLRDDYEVSCPELDTVVEIARRLGEEHGMLGCRMTGGGFGGCAVSIVKTSKVQRLSKDICCAYEKETGVQPFLFTSAPAAGATTLASTLLNE